MVWAWIWWISGVFRLPGAVAADFRADSCLAVVDLRLQQFTCNISHRIRNISDFARLVNKSEWPAIRHALPAILGPNSTPVYVKLCAVSVICIYLYAQVYI